MAKSGYVLAGFETLATILDNYTNARRGRWEDNFTPAQVSNCLSKTTSGFLHSFGQDFPGKKKYHKYNRQKGEMFERCRTSGFFDNCTLIADSGGFQISIGRLTKRESDLLYDMYYDWLEEYNHAYDKAFILDIPPGPGCKIFNSFKDVYDKNLESYKKCLTLPDHVLKKIIYVHHFRTPKLWEIYTKIMRDNGFFDRFEYHATGGVVANMASDMSIPCIIYVLPIVPLINEARRFGRNHLNFHILGGANFRDVLFYELFQKVIKDKHDFDLNITYDSSGVFKQIMHARFMHIRDPYGCIHKTNIKSNAIHLNFMNNERVEDRIKLLFDNLCDKWGFKKINIDGMYDPERNTFWEDVKTYSVFYTLDLYSQIQQEMREFADEIYPIWKAGDEEEFYQRCLEATRVLNQGKITKKQKIKAHSIHRSLEILSDLDEDYCHHLVDRHLAKDEFIELDPRSRVLTV